MRILPNHRPAVNTPPAGTAWAARADELAAWAWRLVNRTDVWGAYSAPDRRGVEYTRADGTKAKVPTSYTAPPVAKRGRVVLTQRVLARHFRGAAHEHVIGLHTTSPGNTSLWGAAEIDWHGEGSADPAANFAAARAWYDEAREVGLSALLTDSNGKGGFHVRILFDRPAPTHEVYVFLRWLVRDHARHGLAKPPEVFPKQAAVDDHNPFGNWLRLPGRHHTREHWARVWDGGGWLEGEAAVDRLLATRGGDPDLLLSPRVASYARKLPQLGEGQGRHHVAYTFACFLVRDLHLNDALALRWLERWDAGNGPPLGRDELLKQVACAHQYGKHAYGNGRPHDAAPPPKSSGPAAPPAEGQLAWQVIKDFFRREYGDGFRVGAAVYSPTERREVVRQEAVAALPSALIDALGRATNAPRFPDGGGVNEEKLPGLWKKWAGTAWVSYRSELPDEDGATPEAAAIAREDFTQLVRQALLSEFQVRWKVRDEKGKTEDHVELRSAVGWCEAFAKTGSWRTVRSKKLWCRREARDGGEEVLKVALRHDVFAQLKADHRLIKMGPATFVRRATRYGLGAVGGQGQRPAGQWAFILADDFVADLAASSFDEGESCTVQLNTDESE
jgi:hypothetical protein